MEISITELSALLNGTVEGNGSLMLNTVSKIEEGKEGALSFLANPKYEEHIYSTGSSAVLVNRNFVAAKPVSTVLIRVDDPYAAFTFLLEKFSNPSSQLTGIEEMSFVDGSAHLGANVYVGAFAYISKGAKVGNKTKIYPQVFLGENVQIGSNCIIYPGVKIYHECVVGDNCIIHASTVIGSDGFGFAPLPDRSYKKIPQTGNVIIEDDVEIGSNCSIDRATMGSTIIRKGVKLDNLIQIAHNVTIGQHTVIASQTGVSGSTELGKYCTIGGQAGFVGHIKIADYTKIGAQSGVSKNIDTPNQVWNGSPAAEFRQNMRLLAAMRKLPDLIEKIANLERQIAKKEG